MSNDLEVTVVLSCTSTGKVSREKVVAPETVSELQDLVQERFSVPKCLQKLKLEDSTLLLPSQKLSDVYIRSQDSIIVEYLAKADVERISRFCRDLQLIVAIFRKLSEARDHLKGYCSIDNEEKSTVQGVTGLFHSVSFSCLIPWHDVPKIEANRQFLNQEDGVRLTIELLSLLLEAPLSSLTNSLQMLLISCLSLLWNFAETRTSRCVVVRLGGFQLMLKALLLCKDQSDQDSDQFGMFDLFDHAVGCISNYSEIEECQLQLAQNSLALDLLLTFALHGSSLIVFTKMLVANCMFRLSHNKAVHQCLSQPAVMEKILTFLANFNEIIDLTYHFVIGYVLSVAVARIVLLSFNVIPAQFHSKMAKLLEYFLTKAKARGGSVLAAAEEKLQCNWLTVVPFLDVFLTPSAEFDQAASSSTNVPREPDSLKLGSLETDLVDNSLSVMMFALNVEMTRKRNRKLLTQQSLLDFVVILPWMVADKWRETAKVVIAEFKKDQEHLPVPKLYSIAAACAAKHGMPLGHFNLFSK